jgi:hypothetical protein
MAHQIVKQPNGLYAIWSTVVDNFIVYDATPEEIIAEEQVEMHERIAKQVRQAIADLESGVECTGYRTFEERVETIKAVHGANDDTLAILRGLGLIS